MHLRSCNSQSRHKSWTSSWICWPSRHMETSHFLCLLLYSFDLQQETLKLMSSSPIFTNDESKTPESKWLFSFIQLRSPGADFQLALDSIFLGFGLYLSLGVWWYWYKGSWSTRLGIVSGEDTGLSSALCCQSQLSHKAAWHLNKVKELSGWMRC